MRVMWFWKEGHKVELSVSSHHFKVHTINSLYHCWCWLWLRSLRLCLSGLCTIQLIFFFFLLSILYSLEENHYIQPNLHRESYASRVEYLHKLFGIFRVTFVNSHIYLCNHFFLFLWIHEYMIYTLSHDPIYYIAHIFPALGIGILSIWSCIPLTYSLL